MGLAERNGAVGRACGRRGGISCHRSFTLHSSHIVLEFYVTQIPPPTRRSSRDRPGPSTRVACAGQVRREAQALPRPRMRRRGAMPSHTARFASFARHDATRPSRPPEPRNTRGAESRLRTWRALPLQRPTRRAGGVRSRRERVPAPCAARVRGRALAQLGALQVPMDC